MQLSACLITRNEEASLPRCLQSLHGIADEIVIVDSGSTDRTAFIATDHNARFLPRPWEGYASQKNFAASKATRPWVLSLDADEELSPALRESLLQLKARGPDAAAAAYEINRVVIYRDRPVRFGDWYPDWLPRLFLKDRGRFTGGSVHERLEIDGPVLRLEGGLFHHTYRDAEDQLARATHYAELWAADAAGAGTSCGPLAPHSHAAWRFLRSWALKRGWTAGPFGLEIARLQARETFLKYQALRRARS
jgi:glycosyltransferase involved in cell wall biosynthesis